MTAEYYGAWRSNKIRCRSLCFLKQVKCNCFLWYNSSIKNYVVLLNGIDCFSGRTISNKKKQAVPAFGGQHNGIFRIQIFGAVAFRYSTKVICKIARCAALEFDGVAEVSCGRQNKKLKDLLEHPTFSSRFVVEMADDRKHHSEPDDELWRTHSCCGRKGAGKREERCAEHDQCHGEPRQSGDCRPCRNHCSREVK